MAIITEGTRNAWFLVSEAAMWRSRDQVTVTVPEGGLDAGTVLATDGSTFSPVGVDGEPAGVLLMNQHSAGNVQATVIARNAEVNGEYLIHPDGATDAQISTINAGLTAAGVVVR